MYKSLYTLSHRTILEQVYSTLVPLLKDLHDCEALRSLRFCVVAGQDYVAYDTAQQWCLISGILSTLPQQSLRGGEVVIGLNITDNNASGAKNLKLIDLCWSDIDNIATSSLELDRLVFVAERIGYTTVRKAESFDELAEEFKPLIVGNLPRCASLGILRFRL